MENKIHQKLLTHYNKYLVSKKLFGGIDFKDTSSCPVFFEISENEFFTFRKIIDHGSINKKIAYPLYLNSEEFHLASDKLNLNSVHTDSKKDNLTFEGDVLSVFQNTSTNEIVFFIVQGDMDRPGLLLTINVYKYSYEKHVFALPINTSCLAKDLNSFTDKLINDDWTKLNPVSME